MRYLEIDFQEGIYKDSTNPADPEPELHDVPDRDGKEKDNFVVDVFKYSRTQMMRRKEQRMKMIGSYLFLTSLC